MSRWVGQQLPASVLHTTGMGDGDAMGGFETVALLSQIGALRTEVLVLRFRVMMLEQALEAERQVRFSATKTFIEVEDSEEDSEKDEDSKEKAPPHKRSRLALADGPGSELASRPHHSS